ncbi:metallophosphoesterase [Echinicola strongylocentroti]|uniref:Metallophosphoesterase n=1 Tax=Echinicola strongylocentroti TaxID=1795355 RepID=A0A2Z4IPL6_9BACT|nr:calcineurin-like phosphoesterase family protein [Echinicola strongylocentroti]AWW33012.1 metallophosphoesterase [Echinicola strongylocentroti]
MMYLIKTTLWASACYIALSLTLPVKVHAQQNVSGIVFEDMDRNGKKGHNEKGLPGVSVTNGQEVSLTDKDGKYILPASNDMIVSVIKPSGYAVPVNDHFQPQFYYIHKPGGSPDSGERGVAPTGELPASVDFALIPQIEENNFSVLVFGDPQADDSTNAGYFETAIVDEVIGGRGAAFGISLGDLGSRQLFPTYIASIGKIGVPWYNLLGNHDMNHGDTDKLTDETYEASFGPANYAFNYGNAHFIVLDDVISPDPYGRRSYIGGFRDDILTFVKNDLKHVPKDKLIVLAFHIPIYEFEKGPDQFIEGNRERLFGLLKGYDHTLSLSGHTHSENHHFFTSEEGWPNKGFHHHYNPGATSGSIYIGPKDSYGTPSSIMRDGTPKGYAFLHITGNSYTYEYVPSGDNDWKMSIHIPKIVPKAKKYRGEVSVNFFQGSPRDSVMYRVDGGKWEALKRSPEYDKFLLDIHYEWDHAEELPWGIRPSTPLISSHIWTGRMPSDLPLGDHTMEIMATDWLGRTYRSSKTFTIVPDHK